MPIYKNRGQKERIEGFIFPAGFFNTIETNPIQYMNIFSHTLVKGSQIIECSFFTS
jgi:hypothetical protein